MVLWFFNHDVHKLEMFPPSVLTEVACLLTGPSPRSSLDNRTMKEVLSRVRLYILALHKLIVEHQFHFIIASYIICWQYSKFLVPNDVECDQYILLKRYSRKGRLTMPRIPQFCYKYV
jgi:hypothetical protein